MAETPTVIVPQTPIITTGATPPVVGATPTMVAPDVTPSYPSSSNPSKKPLILVGLALLFLVTAAGALAYWKLVLANPEKIMLQVQEEFENAQSLAFAYADPEHKVELSGSVFSDQSQLSEVLFKAQNWDNDEVGDFTLATRYSENELYFKINLENLTKWERDADSMMASLRSLQTYQLLRPVAAGESWLFFDLKTFASKTVYQNQNGNGSKKQFTPEDQELLQEKLLAALDYKKVNPFYFQDGKRQTQVIIGFHKDKLLEAVDALKDTNLEMKVSDVNSFKDAISKMDGWDADLIELYISSNGQLQRMVVRMPTVPKDVLDESMQKTTKSAGSASPLSAFIPKNLSSMVPESFKSQDSEEVTLVELGEVVFSDYNSVPPIAKPTPVTDWSDVMKVMEVELSPLLGSYMMGRQNPGLMTPPPSWVE